MQAVLVMFRNDGERRSFSISREMTVIGRRQDCDLMIPLGEISRKHCRIIRDGDGLRIEDLGSSNGTFVNGRRIQETVLGAGDTITVGPVSFVIQIDGVPEDDEIQPGALGAGAAAAGGALAAGADDDDDELQALGDDEDLEATPGTELDTDDALLEEDEDDAMAKPVIRKGAPAGDDDDAIEELDEPSDAELDAVEDGGAGALALDDSETGGGLDPIALDDEEDAEPAKPAAAAKPKAGGAADEDDLLDVLSGDDDAELGEIDTADLLEADDDVSLDDEKPKRRK